MRSSIVTGLAIILLSISGASQTPADFSGTWSLPPDAPLGPTGKPLPAPGFGTTINIRQDATSATISKILGGRTIHVVHPLDGSATQNRTPGRLCEGDSINIWTATRKDNVIETAMVGVMAPGATTPTKANVRTNFRLVDANTMSVELTFQNPNMKEPQTRTTVYKRTGPPADVPPPPPAAPVSAKIGQLEWLGGTWIGTTTSSAFEERWTPPAGGSMLAVARSLRSSNTIMSGFEFLCIVERNGGLVYQAMPNGRQPATDFTLTKMEGQSLRFENPAHDFPKMITYTVQADGTLEAVISGAEGQKPQTFRFKRQ